MAVGGGAGDVAAVKRCHLLEIGKGAKLFAHFLAQANGVFIKDAIVELGLFCLFGLDQRIDAVKRHPAVIADDAAAAIGVRQAGNDAGFARGADIGGIGVEHALIVRLAIAGEDLLGFGIERLAIGLEAIGNHLGAASRHDGTLEGRIGLQPDNGFKFAVDIAGVMGEKVGGNGGIGIEHATGVAFLLQQALHLVQSLVVFSSAPARKPASPS